MAIILNLQKRTVFNSMHLMRSDTFWRWSNLNGYFQITRHKTTAEYHSIRSMSFI